MKDYVINDDQFTRKTAIPREASNASHTKRNVCHRYPRGGDQNEYKFTVR